MTDSLDDFIGKNKIFISHTWEDNDLVYQLGTELKNAGIEIWVDYNDVRGGDNLPERISEALQWCNTLLLIWSEAASKSYWVKLEWTNAISLKKVIIPCRLDSTELPSILANTKYINFSDVKKGLIQLRQTLRLPGVSWNNSLTQKTHSILTQNYDEIIKKMRPIPPT